MKMNIAQIAKAVDGALPETADKTREIVGFYSDSRTPSRDKLFLALKGERVDGNTFAAPLLEKGFCALCDNESAMPNFGTYILVKDTRNALQELACFYRKTEVSKIPFVGITGSVGKTTTKDMVACALSSQLNVYKTQGNANSQIGLPQTVLAVTNEHQCAVVELGMSYKGEMERISRCAMPDISIITNIGYSHIENLGTREAIRDEKLKIARFSKSGSVLLLNGDEPLLKNLDIKDKTVYYISADDNTCDCYAKDFSETESGVAFIGCIFGNEYSVSMPVKGIHFVSNALFALATASLLGLNVTASAEALKDYKSDGKRQHIYESNGHTVISDCYNASPESMKAALSVLASSKGRRIAVLGDMLELGAESPDLHKKVGEYVTESADILVTFGEMARFIAIGSGVKEVYSFDKSERENMELLLKTLIKNGDTVLYKASNGMNLGSSII